MSPQPAEPDLRDRLGGALPDSYPALDLDAVLASGRRTVRRRRVGAVVAVAAAALVVAVGATQLVTGRPTATPQPARSSTDHRFPSGSATITVGQPNKGDRTWTVRISATGGDGLQAVQWQEKGTDRTFGSAVPHDVASWGTQDGTPFVFGVLPDEGAQSTVLTSDDGAHDGNSFQVVRVPGTGWSAFVLAFGKPFVGTDRITHLLWFDGTGRPVDELGNTGSVTKLDGNSVWLSRDGSVLGTNIGGGTYSTPMTGTSDKDRDGAWPRVTTGVASAAQWQMTVRLRPETVSAVLVMSDGRRVPVTPSRLGGWSVAVTPTLTGPTPNLARVEWTSAGGVRHDDAVPPVTAG